MPKIDGHVTSPHALEKNDGLTRTDLFCHACNKNFIATLDFSLQGNHAVECPHCGHLHYRKIENGVVTSQRYDSDSNTHHVPKRHVWKSTTQPMTTSVAHAFIRQRWLERGLDKD
jgi:DNA-directed RNA polymerase subunit RPC12/RpoP